MTTECNTTGKIVETDTTCSISTDCEPQDITDSKSLDKDNLTKATIKCNNSDDLCERNSEKVKDTNEEMEENTAKENMNEKTTFLQKNDLNDERMSVDGTFDETVNNEALGYSPKVNDGVYYDQDTLIVCLDESLENLQNESFENRMEPAAEKPVLNDKDQFIQDWSAVHDVENSLEEGEIIDETSDSEAPRNGLRTLIDQSKMARDWRHLQNQIMFSQRIKPMESVFGLLCMSFKNGPYEFTLTNLTHYISGECDENKEWLKNLNLYIHQLNITDLHVSGHKQASIIHKYVSNVNLKVLCNRYLPKRVTSCPHCNRYGCSKYKAICILHYNFNYDFKIPCTFQKHF